MQRTIGKHEKTIGILMQAAILFAIGIMAIGVFAFFSQQIRSDLGVRNETEARTDQVVDELTKAIEEYPAHSWLLKYWYEHADKLDVEYDVDYDTGVKTKKKAMALSKKYPDINLHYATKEDIEKMDPKDQKIYAEVVYSWFITRVNEIKAVFKVDFLFGAIPFDSFRQQFFLFSAADPGAVRGTEYGQAYPLGHTSTLLEESQRQAMIEAMRNKSHIASAGDYVDDYTLYGEIDGMPLLFGTTYNVSALKGKVNRQTITRTLIVIGYGLLLGILCMILLYRYVIRPLKRVTATVRDYAETKDSSATREGLDKIIVHNEIGELADNISDLSLEMDAHLEEIRTITSEKERIGAELSVATRIQESMLPNIFPAFPEKTEFDIYASMEPAKEVGGDFYDFFLVDDDHVCIVIADVAGKGIPAALFMMASMIIISNNAKLGKSPAQILKDTNETICSNNSEEMFVTVWLAILEISTGRMTCANAGHEYPMIRNADGSFEMLKDKHDFVVGAMEGVGYREYELQMDPGSKVFVYTDGVAEATDSDNNLFGTDRIIEALNGDPDAAPEQILRNVHARVDEFVDKAEQFDDLTMICLEYKGKQ